MTTLPPEIEERRARTKEWFDALQLRIIAELERLEDEAPADLYPEPAGRFGMPKHLKCSGMRKA